MIEKELIKILEKHGWTVLRIAGSHHRVGKGALRTTVPVHGKRDIGKGLLAAIEKKRGLKSNECIVSSYF
jgi:predicted RNA binding protein YcfA (HicA-like mRNA interferase family)